MDIATSPGPIRPDYRKQAACPNLCNHRQINCELICAFLVYVLLYVRLMFGQTLHDMGGQPTALVDLAKLVNQRAVSDERMIKCCIRDRPSIDMVS